MAGQNPAFYFYHGMREALSIAISSPHDSDLSATFDGRQGEVYAFATDFAAGDLKFIDTERPNTPAADAIDHLIIAGHNWNDADLQVFTLPTVVFLLGTTPVTVANGELLIVPLTQTQDVLPDHEILRFQLLDGSAPGAVVPEMTEFFYTTKRIMTRGPEPGWDHPWLRSQIQFSNESGVTSTWLKGSARKRFKLTWRHLSGADRQIMFDLREQTNDWSEPFYFQPPDDIYPTLLMELARDSEWTQDFLDPLSTGTTDEVTLDLIEVKG